MIRPGGFNVLPPVIKNLVIINALMFLATWALGNRFGGNLVDILGLRFPLSERFEPYQIVTYMFMHGSFGHLFFNMFALWMFGSQIENHWGPSRFFVYYFITGIGAAITHYFVVYLEVRPMISAVESFMASPSHEALKNFLNSGAFKIVSYEIQANFESFRLQYNSLINEGNTYEATNLATRFVSEYKMDYFNAYNVVGASGSVYGILLAFGMMFPNQTVYLFFTIPVKVKYLVIFYGGLTLYSSFTDVGGGIAHFAHLGGMIFGFIMIMIWRKRPDIF